MRVAITPGPATNRPIERLLVYQAITFAVVFRVGGQTRIKIRPHGLQNEADVKSSQSPGRLVKAGCFEANLVQHSDANRICDTHRHQAAGHECEAKLQKSRRFLARLGKMSLLDLDIHLSAVPPGSNNRHGGNSNQ